MEKYYSVTQIAKMYNVSREAVHQWIKNGKLKAVQVGKLYRISENEIKKFIRGE